MNNDNKIDISSTSFWLILVTGYVLFLALATYGYASSGAEQTGWQASAAWGDNLTRLYTAAYYAVQLTFFDASDSFHTHLNWPLALSGFLLPLFPAVALLQLLARVFGVQRKFLVLKLRPAEHVFLGGGSITRGLVDTLETKHNTSLLVIDADIERCRARQTRRRRRFMLLEHDVNDSRFLFALRLHKAQCIYIFTGDDERNLLVARKVAQRLLAQRGTLAPLQLVVNVESRQLLSLAAEEPDFVRLRQRGVDLIWFAAAEEKARGLTRCYPVVERPKPTVHVGLCGNSPDVPELVLQVIRQTPVLPDDDNDKPRLHITLFSTTADRYQQLLANCAVLDDRQRGAEYQLASALAQIEWVQVPETGMTPESVREAERRHGRLPLDSLYVLEASDYSCFMSVFAARQSLTVVQPQQQTRLACLLAGDVYANADDAGKAFAAMFAGVRGAFWFHGVFDLFDENEGYPGEVSDVIGREVNAAYATTKETSPEKPSLAQEQSQWLALAEKYRASSRYAGDHFDMKLRYLGLRLAPASEACGAEDREVVMKRLQSRETFDTLVRFEHQRFVNERLLAGNYYQPQTDKALNLNNTLCPFAALNAGEPQKDEAIIRNMQEILAKPEVYRQFRVVPLSPTVAD